MIGRIRVHIKDEVTPIYADIIDIDTKEKGEDRNSTRLEPQENITLYVTNGIAECFDITDNDEILWIEVDRLNTRFEFCPDIELRKTYVDFSANCTVIEF